MMHRLPLLFTLLISPGIFAQGKREQVPLLKTYMAVHMDNQLEDSVKYLEGFLHVEYLTTITNCKEAVIRALDQWASAKAIMPASYRREDARIRMSVAVSKPKAGEMIFLYRYFPQKRKASLEILFDSNGGLLSEELESLVKHFGLLELKKSLIQSIKCQ